MESDKNPNKQTNKTNNETNNASNGNNTDQSDANKSDANKSNNDQSNNTSEISDDFLTMIEEYLPEGSSLDEFKEACLYPLKKSITVNTHKISVEDFIAITAPMGWTLTPNEFTDEPVSFYIDREDTSTALWNTFLYKTWFFYIQEVAASLPARLIDPKPWKKILDMCASPWWKTTQLASQLLGKPATSQKENTWELWLVVANDVANSRIKTLAHNLNLWWVYNTLITRFNGFMFGKHLPNYFDHVLVDAPCSGEWTWFKSDFALKFRRQEEVNKIAGTQFQLLVSAIKTTKVWWTIIYSTCTLNPFENEGVLARVLDFFKWSVVLETVNFSNLQDGVNGEFNEATFTDWDAVQRLWPHIQKTWWFFVSKLRKVDNHENDAPIKWHKLLPKNQFTITMHKKLQKQVSEYAHKQYGVKIDETKHFFIATKNKVYLTSPVFKSMQQDLHCEKVWIPVFKVDRRHDFRPTHYFGLIFWAGATKNTVMFDAEQMQTYVSWKNVETETVLDKTENPHKVIQRSYGDKTRWMSTTKRVKWVWKNKYGK